MELSTNHEAERPAGWLTEAEVAKILGISLRTLRYYRVPGSFPRAYKIGGRIYYKRDELGGETAPADNAEEARGLSAEWRRNMICEREAAEILGVSAQTLRRRRSRARGPRYFKIGRHVVYREADVAAYLEASGLNLNIPKS